MVDIQIINAPERSKEQAEAEARQEHMQRYTEFLHKTETEMNEIFDFGFYNEVVLGYLTLALQECRYVRAEQIVNAQQALQRLFGEVGAKEARKAYRDSLNDW